MKKILTGVFLSVAAVHAMAQAMSPAAKEAHTRTLQCLNKYSVQLDDGVSNVETIAKVAANSCREESVRFVDLWTAGVQPIDKQAILAKVVSNNVESAQFYILSNRASKK
ncbi:hypothetical protein [Pseudoduganella sp. HUAS MS19]